MGGAGGGGDGSGGAVEAAEAEDDELFPICYSPYYRFANFFFVCVYVGKLQKRVRMGIYTSKHVIVVKKLPDSLSAKLPDDSVVIKTAENKYIIAPDFKINEIIHVENQKNIVLTEVKFINTDGKGVASYITNHIHTGAQTFRPGKLPLTNFRIIRVETDAPGGGLPFLIHWGLERDIRYKFYVLADMNGAEFDVTHYLSEYITSEIEEEYDPSYAKRQRDKQLINEILTDINTKHHAL